MRTPLKRAMQAQKLRYFSSLTPKQKDKSIAFVIGAKFDDLTLILTGVYIQIFKPDLNRCKMFYLEEFKIWVPINIKELIK